MSIVFCLLSGGVRTKDLRHTIYLVLAGPLVLYLAPPFELPGKILSGLSLFVTKKILLFPGSLAPLQDRQSYQFSIQSFEPIDLQPNARRWAKER